MRKIRIGNDVHVSWEVKTGGEAVSLEGKTLKVYVKSAYTKQEITDFTVAGCVIDFVYPASMQKTVGARAVLLHDVTEGGSEKTICADNAFWVVAHSSEEDEDNVDFEDFMVSLKSNILLSVPGPSAYEVWLANGNKGTVDDFLLSLRGEKGDTADYGTISIDTINKLWNDN